MCNQLMRHQLLHQSGEMLFWSTLFFWRLECLNGPDSPGAHVYIGVRTLAWKADYWKELIEPFFYHVGRLCSWLWVFTQFKKHHLTSLEQGFCQAGFILHTLCRLGMMGMADNCTFSLTVVDLKSQSVSLLLQVWKFAQTFLKFTLSLVVKRDTHWYFFSYGYWNEDMGVFQVEMDSLGCKPIF